MSLPGIFTPFLSFLTFLLLFAQYGGAIYNAGTLAVKYGNFTGNSASDVCVIAPHSQCPYQKMLEIPGRDFLTFLLLFAQAGGAIDNAGTLTVKYGNFTGNSADGGVCIIAPIASAPTKKCSKSRPGNSN